MLVVVTKCEVSDLLFGGGKHFWKCQYLCFQELCCNTSGTAQPNKIKFGGVM